MTGGATPGCPSPCVGICRLIPGTDLCEGCLRTLPEISAWASAGEDEKRRIAEAAACRRHAGTGVPEGGAPAGNEPPRNDGAKTPRPLFRGRETD